MIFGENFPDAAASNQELRRVCVAETCAASDERLKLPRAIRERLRGKTLRLHRYRRNEKQNGQAEESHRAPALSANLRSTLKSEALA
jgi:hypothetical protein